MRYRTILVSLAISAPAFAGPLTPPGAPAPTMKTLDEVEPSTPINATNTPGDADSKYRITLPGAYHLTENLIGENAKSGIEIFANDVYIDLRGYTIIGAGGATDEGINLDADRITVRNGSIKDAGNNGIFIASGTSHRIENVSITGCDDGIRSNSASASATIVDCVLESNSGNGLDFAGTRLEVRDTAAIANGVHGYTTVATDARFLRCTSIQNGTHGFVAVDDATFERCSAKGNLGDGIKAENRALVLDCETARNSRWGVLTSTKSVVKGNSIASNGEGGIWFSDNSLITQNLVVENGLLAIGGPGFIPGPGMFTTGSDCHVSHNTLRANAGYGLEIPTGAGTLYHSNSFTGNSGGGSQLSVAGTNTSGDSIDAALLNIVH